MTEYNSTPASFDTSSLKRIDGVAPATAAPTPHQPAEAISDMDLKNVHQEVGGNQMIAQASTDVDYAFDAPAFTSEAGYPVTDSGKITSKTIVQIGAASNKMTVGCAMAMGLLQQNGPGNYSISEKGYDLMSTQVAQGKTPRQTQEVNFSAGSDTELISAIDYKLGGGLTQAMMGAVTRHANGQDAFDGDTLELIRSKMPGTDPAKIEAALSNYLQNGVSGACSFVGGQTGFTGSQVLATLETKSSAARATFLRAVVAGIPNEALAVWQAIKNGSLK